MKSGTNASWAPLIIALVTAMVVMRPAAAQTTTTPGSTGGTSTTTSSTSATSSEVGVYETEALSGDQSLVVQNTSFRMPICANFVGSDPNTGKPTGTPYSMLLRPRSSFTLNYSLDLAPKMNLSLTAPTSLNIFSFPVKYGPQFQTQDLGSTTTTPTVGPSCPDLSAISPGILPQFSITAKDILRGEYLNIYEAFPSPTGSSWSGKTAVRRTKVDPYDLFNWSYDDRGGGGISLAVFLLLAGSFELCRTRRHA